MTSRSDGTNTTTYAWDEDNRLTLVTLPSSATVAYTWDVLGRMLTRTDSTGTTYFTWDGWNMVAELAPNGTQTRYYAPNGELLYFEVETPTTDQPAVYGSAYYGQNYYGALVYQVVSDALGSVRRIVDAYNNVVSTFDYDAYGRQLSSTSDPLGFPYRFVGGYGVRWDAGTGLYYMRNRWYDSDLGRFLSRDTLSNLNLYEYARNNPTNFIDISGNDPIGAPSPGPGPSPDPNTPSNPQYSEFEKAVWAVASNTTVDKTACFLGCLLTPDVGDVAITGVTNIAIRRIPNAIAIQYLEGRLSLIAVDAALIAKGIAVKATPWLMAGYAAAWVPACTALCGIHCPLSKETQKAVENSVNRSMQNFPMNWATTH